MTAVAWPAQLELAAELARAADRPSRVARPGRSRPPGPFRLIVVPDGRTLDSLTRGRAPAWGAAVALPGRADHPPPRRPGRSPPAPSATSWPTSRCTRRCRSRAALVRRGLRRAGPPASGSGSGPRAQSRRGSRGDARPSTRLDGALRGSASTADAAYALAVSAVTELARRNPTGTLDAAAAAARARATTSRPRCWPRRAHARSVRGGVAAGRPTAVQPGPRGSWPVAAGRSSASCVLWLVHRRRRADRARRAALDDGWVVEPGKPRTGLNLTRLRNRSSLIALCLVPAPQCPPQGSPPTRRFCSRAETSIILAAAVLVLVAGYLTLPAGHPSAAAVILVFGYCVLFPIGNRPLSGCWSSRHGPCVSGVNPDWGRAARLPGE